LNRVEAVQSPDIFGLDYDKEKYREILLDAVETVLGIFGFDRTLYGKPKDKRNTIHNIEAEAGMK
jgi:hypothetical protein